MTFTATLAAAWQQRNSLLCVGLDPEPTRFPGANMRERTPSMGPVVAAAVNRRRPDE